MKRVVIIGGGFAGTYAAKKLQRDFNVTIIDCKDYFEFTPGILRTITEPEHLNKIQILHKDYLKKAKFICGHVSEVGKNFVKIKNKIISFDYLIIASGSRYESPIKEQDVLSSARTKEVLDYNFKLKKAKRVTIIGGGLVGVELASEITSRFKEKEITIIQADEKIMPRSSERSIKYAKEFLEKSKVKIIYDEKAIKKENNSLITNKGTKIKYDLAFLCTGIKANSEFMKKNFSKLINEKDQIKVNDFLQMEGFNNIFVAGDVSSVLEEKLAQVARYHAQYIVKNIKALEKNKELKKYSKKKRVIVISLGKYNGIFEYGNFILTGLIPSIMKSMIEKRIMLEYKLSSILAKLKAK